MLSARTKDSTSIPIVNKLFSKVKTPRDLLAIPSKKLEKSLYGIGFYRTKTKYAREMAKILIERFDSLVPDSIEQLLTLPGVGRKTANIVLARAFGKKTLGVDVHVHRISNRLGLVKTKKPEDTEKALMKIIPSSLIPKYNEIFVSYGQTICKPVAPLCSTCKLSGICPKIGVKIDKFKNF
jgi:endonuclease-3